MIKLKADLWGLEALKDEMRILGRRPMDEGQAIAMARALAWRDEICRRIHEQVDLAGEALRPLRKLRVIAKDRSSKGEAYYAPYRARRGGRRSMRGGQQGTGKQFSLRTDPEPCKPENVIKTLMATGKLSDPDQYLIRVSDRKGYIRVTLWPPRGRGPVFNALYKRFWYGPSFGTNQQMRDDWQNDWHTKINEYLRMLQVAVQQASASPPSML